MTVRMDARPTNASGRRAAAARFVLPAVILVAGLIGHLFVAEAGDRRAHERTDHRAEAVADALKARVNAYGGVLYGVRGLFAASAHVTATEFHVSHVARAVEQRYPGVKVVGFADLLRPADVEPRTRQIRREVRESGLAYPRFEVHPRPARHARRMAPISYLEPQETNEPAFGLDFMSEPRRRAALERTLTTRKPEATAPLRLIQEPADQRGFLVMLGVWDRRGDAVGAAYAAFRMGDLVDRVVPRTERHAAIEVYDLGPSNARPLPIDRAAPMYDTDARKDALRPHTTAFGSHTIRFDVMGRHWAVHYAPDHSLAAPDQVLLNWLPLIIAAVLAALAGWLLGVSLRTERRAVALAERMTQSLRESQTDLARSNAELERFAYVASHDLREPLRTITGFLGLLSRRHRDRLDDGAREFIDLAVAGAKRMDSLIAELLEYSRTGRSETTTPEPTDLEAAWSVAVRNLSAAIAEAGAEVTASPLPVVLADRGEMVQVLQNLLGNAIKYHGGEHPRIHAEAVRRGDEWEISVCDDGPGIDPRHHERIFVLLQRLHRDDEVEGTGMGLAICKKIVEHHGGRIWVDSAEGEGARFTFALRAAEPARVREPAPA
jgi:signal transduction histidine kinase